MGTIYIVMFIYDTSLVVTNYTHLVYSIPELPTWVQSQYVLLCDYSTCICEFTNREIMLRNLLNQHRCFRCLVFNVFFFLDVTLNVRFKRGILYSSSFAYIHIICVLNGCLLPIKVQSILIGSSVLAILCPELVKELNHLCISKTILFA